MQNKIPINPKHSTCMVHLLTVGRNGKGVHYITFFSRKWKTPEIYNTFFIMIYFLKKKRFSQKKKKRKGEGIRTRLKTMNPRSKSTPSKRTVLA